MIGYNYYTGIDASEAAEYINRAIFTQLYSIYEGSKKSNHILVLDLDETIVHCEYGIKRDAFAVFHLLEDNIFKAVSLYLRPHLHKFLKVMKKCFSEIVLYTSSVKSYADTVMNYVDPGKKYFSRRFYRDSLVTINGEYKKDLRRVSHDLSRVILVDDSPSLMFQKENCCKVIPFHGNLFDSNLIYLSIFLQKIANYIDIRIGIGFLLKCIQDNNLLAFFLYAKVLDEKEKFSYLVNI